MMVKLAKLKIVTEMASTWLELQEVLMLVLYSIEKDSLMQDKTVAF